MANTALCNNYCHSELRRYRRQRVIERKNGFCLPFINLYAVSAPLTDERDKIWIFAESAKVRIFFTGVCLTANAIILCAYIAQYALVYSFPGLAFFTQLGGHGFLLLFFFFFLKEHFLSFLRAEEGAFHNLHRFLLLAEAYLHGE